MYGSVFVFSTLFFTPVPHYRKPYLTTDQQVALLISRGMAISDTDKAKSCLARIGYYRLSAYWFPFRKSQQFVDPITGQPGTQVLDEFHNGTDFPTILNLYVFDKKLRMIVLDALERIEIALRTEIALLLGRHGAWAHRDRNVLHGNFARRNKKGEAFTLHTEWLNRLDAKFRSSKEDFAKHFKSRYSSSDPPIWIAVELLDFGALSHFYAGMTVADQNTIAARYGLTDGKAFETWLRCLNDVRNICAHHSRLWNRPLVAQPRWPLLGVIPDLDHLDGDTHGQTRLYAALAIMRCMLKVVNPSSTWGARLVQHLDTVPVSPFLSLKSAGFPASWKRETVWA